MARLGAGEIGMMRFTTTLAILATLTIQGCSPLVETKVSGSSERLTFSFSVGHFFGDASDYVDEIRVTRQGLNGDDTENTLVWHIRSNSKGQGVDEVVYGKVPEDFSVVVEPSGILPGVVYSVSTKYGADNFVVKGPDSDWFGDIQIVG